LGTVPYQADTARRRRGALLSACMQPGCGRGRLRWECQACESHCAWARPRRAAGCWAQPGRGRGRRAGRCVKALCVPRSAGKAKAGGGLLGAFVRSLGVSVVGTAALTREDIAGALAQLKRKLMKRNVAEEIAEKCALPRGGAPDAAAACTGAVPRPGTARLSLKCRAGPKAIYQLTPTGVLTSNSWLPGIHTSGPAAC